MATGDSRPGSSTAHPISWRFAKWAVASTALIISLAFAATAISSRTRIGINGTDSLPGVLYVVSVHERPDSRGDTVAFRPPANRFYPRRMAFLKKVLGIPGDRVTRVDHDFFINGKYVGTAKRRSLSGEPLDPGPVGVIPPDHYFVWTPHPDSFDSRYADIGWIPASRIIGRARRLL